MRARKVVSTTGLNFDGADRRRGPRQDSDIALTQDKREGVHCQRVGMQTWVGSVEMLLFLNSLLFGW